jgi:hypothetical protein
LSRPIRPQHVLASAYNRVLIMFESETCDSWNISAEAAERCVRPIQVLLREAESGRLTRAGNGRLSTKSGALISAAIDPAGRWLIPYDSVAHDHVLNSLLEIAVRLGLVRDSGRRIRLRKRGVRAMSNSSAVWQRVIAALPFERDEFGIDVARYLLILMAARAFTSEAEAGQTIDRLILATGWQFSENLRAGIGSIHAAHLTLAMVELAGSVDLAEYPNARAVAEPLSAAGAVLLASAALGNDRLFGGTAANTR